LNVHTTETASVRSIKALLVFLACGVGYGAAAIEQANLGTPWPTAVRVDVTDYHTAHKPPPAPTMLAEKTNPPKRVERLL
jgi:hypothetical protein